MAGLARGGTVSGPLYDIGIPNIVARFGNFTGNRDLDLGDLLGFQRDRERRYAVVVARWRPVPTDDGSSFDAIEPHVPQHSAIGGEPVLASIAPPVPARSAHFEHIAKVRVELQRQRHLDRLQRVVRDPHPLDAVAVPQCPGSEDVQRTARDDHAIALHDVRVGQIDSENRVVFADGGAQEQGTAPAEQQLESGQESRSRVIETLLALLERQDVAVQIEHAERVAVLEHAVRAPAVALGDDREVFVQADHFSHGAGPSCHHA